MKLPFTICDLRFAIQKKSLKSAAAVRRAAAAGNHQSSIINHQSERGIALVITLILLSVTLFMAVAFLAISRRERGSVVTETATVTARLAADSGLANAEAQILATVLQTTNPYNFGLLVSTNYINANGFLSGSANPTNVNYDFYVNGTAPINPVDFIQNVANLWFLPRAPVFAYDRNAHTNEFRFYLDLNQNRQFDPNGSVANMQIGLGGVLFTNGFIQEVGDPEWIGVLERPDAPHGPNNKFLSRYAFIAIPAGNSLDLNAIHNQVLNQSLSLSDGYLRNQGVGSWELNLAAFLADLNTNEWGQVVGSGASAPVGSAGFYLYNQASPLPGANSGASFEDARALLAYRYNFNYGTLKPFSGVGGLFPNYPAGGGAVDMFPFAQPPMFTTGVPFYNYGLNVLWPGANNTNHYFALASDLLDPNKTQNGIGAFINRLQFASTNLPLSTYDRYTFYRLLAQLGTDSAPESDKLNVNYVNVDNTGNIIPNYQTNCLAWEPAQFFTNAADRMLRAYTTRWFKASPSNYLATYYNLHTNYNDPTGFGLTNIPFAGMTNAIPSFGITNIPVWVNDQFVYAPAVQRVLQLAANICDATTNRTAVLGHDFPSVFRPLFTRNNLGNVFITAYAKVDIVSGSGDVVFSAPFNPVQLATPTAASIPVNIYGVPWIIGAKKGFPSFNELSMDSVVTITRKMQVTRSSVAPGLSTTATNLAYVFSVSNAIGVEYWNSYTNSYNSPVQVVVNDNLTLNLTNEFGFAYPVSYPMSQNQTFSPWPGSVWNSGGLYTYYSSPFYLPLNTAVTYLSNSVYQWGGGFSPAGTAGWQANTDLVMPHFGLETTNRLQAFILSSDNLGNQRVIDYVSFNGPDTHRALNAEIETHGGTAAYDNLWDAGQNADYVPWGIKSQLEISKGQLGLGAGNYWSSLDNSGLAKAEMDGFYMFMGGTLPSLPFTLPPGYDSVFYGYTNSLTHQVPFTPTVYAYYYTTWQANDPLVHTLASDLIFSGITPNTIPSPGTNRVDSPPNLPLTNLLPNLGALNNQYQPWGRQWTYSDSVDNKYDTTIKDPLIRQSDDWQFPTNKLPSAGWLGRIHRGTPWQTVYLKATNVLALANPPLNTKTGFNAWKHWTGNANTFDTTNTAPVQDRLLFDLFTAALNDNASRGQLPINVGAADTNNPAAGLAAWSAVLSGMVVPTNLSGAYTIIDPAGVNLAGSQLYAIVTNINYIRSHRTNSDGVIGAFENVGDILSVPALSQNSPFVKALKLTNSPDALVEWLPQQAMSLLRANNQPRYVIYSYGQTLTPAPNGVVNSGAQAGMITNYQVTAETVTRSVVRIEGAPTNSHAVVESYNVLPPD
jgi:hypothetical protein